MIAKDISYTKYLTLKNFPIFREGVYKGGLIAEPKTVRMHPMGKVAERFIGYQDKRGKVGIEGAYAKYLQGRLGRRKQQKIAKKKWKPINDINQIEPKDGQDVITTIDIGMQNMVHTVLLKQLKHFNADHGCVVVMETKTGEIKAISNLAKTAENKYYEKRNYAVWESHESGSIFKIPAFLVALQHKVIDTNTVVNIEKGTFFYKGQRITDSYKKDYGRMSASRAIQISSNIGIVKLITKHYQNKPEKFVNALYDMNLAKPLGLEIKGEGLPIIPRPSDKNWGKITLAWMSWGYGVSLTPLQTLTFYNAIANNGKMIKPFFAKALREEGKIVKTFRTTVIKDSIASYKNIVKIKKILENVVKYGTAKNIYHPKFAMAGKTGTAKKWIPAQKNKDGEILEKGYYSNEDYVASFTGFFPVENPKYSCIVVIHKPDIKKGYYGSQVAAPVFKTIAQRIYFNIPSKQILKYNQNYSKFLDKKYKRYNKLLTKKLRFVPNVKGMPMMDAVALLENMGYKVKFEQIGIVNFQSVRSGKQVYLKSK